jgi:predicted transcriptional regulator
MLLAGLVAFAVINTALLAAYLLTPQSSSEGWSALGTTGSLSPTLTTLSLLQGGSPVLAPASWALVGGVWVWRGRTRSQWKASGFESGVFQLFMRMRGGETRVQLLTSLSSPKNRFQLAQELGLDWKAVDYQVELLRKHGFVMELKAYGNVRLYEVTQTGNRLLELLKDLEDGEAQSVQRDLVREVQSVGRT